MTEYTIILSLEHQTALEHYLYTYNKNRDVEGVKTIEELMQLRVNTDLSLVLSHLDQELTRVLPTLRVLDKEVLEAVLMNIPSSAMVFRIRQLL